MWTVTLAAPGSFLEMQVLGPDSGPSESNYAVWQDPQMIHNDTEVWDVLH